MDILIRAGEPRPVPGKRLLARHPFDAKKRAYVTPSVVIPLLRLVFKGAAASVSAEEYPHFAAAEGASEELKRKAASGSGPVAAGGGGAAAAAAAAGAAGAGGAGGASAAAAGGGGASAAAPPPTGVALRAPSPSLEQLREFVKAQMKLFRTDILRPLNPTPFKVSTSPELFHFLHDLLMVRASQQQHRARVRAKAAEGSAAAPRALCFSRSTTTHAHTLTRARHFPIWPPAEGAAHSRAGVTVHHLFAG
jgi:hypothetical protein